MRRSWLISIWLLVGLPCLKLAAQYAPGANQSQAGVVVPVAISGDMLDTRRGQYDSPSAPSFTVGFRVLATPQLVLGPHWYVYSAIQVQSTPFFYEDAFTNERSYEADVIQGFLGYGASWGKVTLGVKAGQLSTAFGAFPLRYDDAVNPLLDQPLTETYLKLRPDQLPCGFADFTAAHDVNFNCGGSGATSYGMQPATLYGMPGAEIDASWRRWDGRFQLTNSSPTNPRGFFTSSQHPQWAAGGGFTIRQGFRAGVSAFRGPWLDNAVKPFLPPASKITDFSASGLGIDVQWAQGPWSTNGEWQRFVFSYPNFRSSPASNFGYMELKRIINARWYSAIRLNYQANNHPVDTTGKSPLTFLPNRQAYELAVGFRPDRFQLLKVGYEWMAAHGGPLLHGNIFSVQLVTSLDVLSKSFR